MIAAAVSASSYSIFGEPSAEPSAASAASAAAETAAAVSRRAADVNARDERCFAAISAASQTNRPPSSAAPCVIAASAGRGSECQ